MNSAAQRGYELRALWRIRLLHSVAWAVFASAIAAIPVVALLDKLRAAAWLSALVWLEVLILMVNRMRCPLTGVADHLEHQPYPGGHALTSDRFEAILCWLDRMNGER